MSVSDIAMAKACCADLYQSDLAQMLLGDTRHPGGLILTNRLGRLMDLQRDDWVVDLASGNGTSALAISRAFSCKVVGVEFGNAAALEASKRSAEAAVPARATFLQGDAEQPPLKSQSFDSVFAECSLSLFPDKALAIRQAVDLLKPGGKLGISDVTVVPGTLPTELEGSLGEVLCLTEALDAGGYARLMENEGLELIHKEDASEYVSEQLYKIRTGLTALSFFKGTQNPELAGLDSKILSLATSWEDVVSELEKMVHEGLLGYWLYVGQKP